nr:retrovirus-related Pol polyprotein from transposon TNT 1-94 [Tanacetum cinerariifolium]
MHDPLDWKLYDTCGVHHVSTKDQEIFMLVEKDYPLRKGLATVMISNKLQIPHNLWCKPYNKVSLIAALNLFKVTITLQAKVVDPSLGNNTVTILNTLDSLGKFDGKVEEGFLVGYSVSSKAFRVLNSRTRIVQETLDVNFLENKPYVAGSGPTWLLDIDTLTKTMNYQPSSGFRNPQNTDGDAAFDEKELEFEGRKPEFEANVSPSSSAQKQDDKTKRKAKGKSPVEQISPNSTNIFSAAGPSNAAASLTQGKSSKADFNNLETSITVKPKRVHQALKDPSWIEDMQEELLQFKMQKVEVM